MLLQTGPARNARVHLCEAARPSLWELWRATQETVNLAVLEGFEVVYVDCLESPHDLRLVTNVGMRAVFYRTALGKAIAAFLPAERRRLLLESTRFQAFTPTTVASSAEMAPQLEEVRRLGYAVDSEESVLGLRCVSAPVVDASQEAVAAISVSGPTSRFTAEQVSDFAASVLRAARDTSARIASLESG
ncbi:MAG: IclR family transcriptional regulator [bacterium]|nr:IclR family transcriptional regulator [bacterium]